VDPPDAAAFVANSVTTAQYRFRARVLVHAPIQDVAEEVPPTTAVLTADGPDRCVLVTGADSLDGMAFHLARLTADITILEPPELIIRIQALAARLTRATGPAPGTRS
jgi:predicted DNA-binding transcriptional regulator YafY